MTERTSWARVWCTYRGESVRKGLEARLADPLWTLSRQWQFGEFQGDDAASPAKMEVVHQSMRTDTVASLASGSRGWSQPLSDPDLLEPMIEADATEDGPAALRASGEAGLQFLRLLPGGSRTTMREFLQDRYPLRPPADETSGQNARILDALVRGSFDSREFRQATGAELAELASKAGLGASMMRDARAAWEAYYDARFVPAASGVWDQHRLEHRFRVEGSSGDKVKVSLRADEYPGGALGWQSFNLDQGRSKGMNRDLARSSSSWLLPARITYSGMPARRFWDFEDGEVFFGGLAVERTDLAHLVLTEFATVYGNDWFMLPVRLPTGSLNRVTEVRVVDVFGETLTIEPAAVSDGADRAWRFFELSGDPSAVKKKAPWLFLPRAVLGGEEGRAVESVTMVRDEMANLAWGIETTVEGPAGYPVRRDQLWNRIKDELDLYTGETDTPATPADDEADPAWVYRLQTVVPPHWVPFVPEVVEGLPTQNLLRGRMGEWDLLGDRKAELAGAQGRLMDPSAPMSIAEEEILRGGIKVSRHYQIARDPEGRLLLWSSRRKRPSAGEPSSGRKTDVIERDGHG